MQKELRKQEGGPDIELYVGGREKLKQMQLPRPPFKANSNLMLNKLLGAIAYLCASHYTTIDLDELDERYGPRPNYSPRVREGASLAKGDPALGIHLLSKGRKSHIQGKGVPASRSSPPVRSQGLRPAKEQEIRVMPASQQDGDFHTHEYLTDLFHGFGEDDWEQKDQVKSEEDLFQVRRLEDVISSTPVSRQDSATSQSQHGSRGSDRRAAKARRMRGDGSSEVIHEGDDDNSVDSSGDVEESENTKKGKRKVHS